MEKRYVYVWLPFFKTEWFIRRHMSFRDLPLSLYIKDHGRMIVSAVNKLAMAEGVHPGMLLADAKATTARLIAQEEPSHVYEQALQNIAEWFIRFSPVVSIQDPEGIVVDASGCAHLWKSETGYLQDMISRLDSIGYTAKTCMAGTVAAATAIARYGTLTIVPPSMEREFLHKLPPEALRLEPSLVDKLHKLGLRTIGDILPIDARSLQRRFGLALLRRLYQALGHEEEFLTPVHIIAPYAERLPSLEPILTRTGIDIALRQLLDPICKRLSEEQKGVRVVKFTVYTIEGKDQVVEVNTSRATADAAYLFNLFQLKVSGIAPGFGIELFVLEVTRHEELHAEQEALWVSNKGLLDPSIAAFVDKVSNKFGSDRISRFVPARHYWPERSCQPARSIQEAPFIEWPATRFRPVQLLDPPQIIQVTAPIPDYPPMNFRHRNVLHRIIKADGPERMEQEWWIRDGNHRDYYYVEDESGKRYWIFRSGHYGDAASVQWYLHGYCA